MHGIIKLNSSIKIIVYKHNCYNRIFKIDEKFFQPTCRIVKIKNIIIYPNYNFLNNALKYILNLYLNTIINV